LLQHLFAFAAEALLQVADDLIQGRRSLIEPGFKRFDIRRRHGACRGHLCGAWFYCQCLEAQFRSLRQARASGIEL
jgi:hypothetical protein